MATYPTLDNLPTLFSSQMSRAPELKFAPMLANKAGWDSQASASGNEFLLFNDTFRFTAKAGATYNIYSTSYNDPKSLRIFDVDGKVLVANEEGNDPAPRLIQGDLYNEDLIVDWVAPYSGTYYVCADWSQGPFKYYHSIELYEDIDTILHPAVAPATESQAAPGTINEGDAQTYTITTSNISSGTTMFYEFSGISAEDIVGGALSGMMQVGAGGITTLTVVVSADALTEGPETMVLTVRTIADGILTTATGVVINDTSQKAIVPVKIGTPADDLLSGGPGNDTLNGGAGIDTVLYAAPRANFSITKAAGGYLVVDQVGLNGSDSIANVEKIKFSDGTVSLDYNDVVQALYVAYFGRAADTGGLANFQSQLSQLGAPREFSALSAAYGSNPGIHNLIDSFSASDESKALYSGDTKSFIKSIYNNILNRGPDQGGLDFWAGAVDRGELSRANASLSIMAGALENTSVQGLLDAALVNKKTSVASDFSFAIDTPAEVAAYSGNAAAGLVRTMLSNISANTDLGVFQSTMLSTLAGMANKAAFIPSAQAYHLPLADAADGAVGLVGQHPGLQEFGALM